MPHDITRQEFFTLKVEFESERPYEFHFIKPPNREDFINFCYRWLPWTQVWETTLLSWIRDNKCDWPMLDITVKKSTTDIIDDQGIKVGKLSISREYSCHSRSYDRFNILIQASDVDKVVNRLPKENRENARRFLRQQENRIQESISKLSTEDHKVDIPKILRVVLRKNGFYKN